MLRAIAVDDEIKALDRLERLVKEEARVDLVGKFMTAQEALNFAAGQSVDIVFLDIEMPFMTGLELAERFYAGNPSIEVIIVTAYDQYALRAFQAHVTGYLLKPLDIADIREQIDHVLRKRLYKTDKSQSNMLIVRCFGQFHCYLSGNGKDVIRWRTAKAEELFALLLHYQGRPVSKEMIMEQLWPEVEPGKAINHFYVTCTYLRNALSDKGLEDILLRERDYYTVDLDRLQCDMLGFVAGLKEISEEVSDLYTAPYFENKPYEWAIKTRTWFQNEYSKHQYRLAEKYAAEGKLREAIEAVTKVLERDPLEEEAVERLISLRLRMEDNESALRVYREYEQRVQKELGLPPSNHLKGLMQKLF
jgi:two-component system LytT family response regulator